MTDLLEHLSASLMFPGERKGGEIGDRQAECFGGDVGVASFHPQPQPCSWRSCQLPGGARAVPLLGSRWWHCLSVRTCEVEEPFDRFVSFALGDLSLRSDIL